MSTATLSELTEQQQLIFTLIYATARDRGSQPSWREIGRLMGIRSPNGVQCHIRALERKGWLGGHRNDSCSLRLLLRPDGSPFSGFADDPPLGSDSDGVSARTMSVFNFIYRLARENGYQPSYQEVMDEFGFKSRNAVACHLGVLERRKFLTVPGHQARRVTFILRPDGTNFSGFSEKPPAPEDDHDPQE